MNQVFECPQCHDQVKPDHLACYSCGLTAEVRPTVITSAHQTAISEVIEEIDNALSHLINHQLNFDRSVYIRLTMSALKSSKQHLEGLYKEFCGAAE